MSFGKRSTSTVPAKHVASPSPRPSRRYAGAAILAVSVLGLLGVCYAYRVQVLERVYPAGLITVSLYDTAVPLKNEWNLTRIKTTEVMAVSVWTVNQMASLCGDRATAQQYDYKPLHDFLVSGHVLVPTFSADDEPNLYGGDASLTAGKMIEGLALRRDSFCKNDYAVAVYDFRVAGIKSLRAASADQNLIIQRSDYAISVSNGMLAKLKRLGRAPRDDELTEDERILLSCGDESGEALYNCFWKAKDG